MFGLFTGKKEAATKINMASVISSLARCRWDFERISSKENVVVVKGKYRNHQRDCYKVYMEFDGGQIRFKDDRGMAITHIPHLVPMNQMFPTLKNILNVLS